MIGYIDLTKRELSTTFDNVFLQKTRYLDNQ